MRQGLLLPFVLGILFTCTMRATPVRTAGESTTFAAVIYGSSSAAHLLPARGESGRAETSVPEPETFALIGFGLLLIGMVGARRHRLKQLFPQKSRNK